MIDLMVLGMIMLVLVSAFIKWVAVPTVLAMIVWRLSA